MHAPVWALPFRSPLLWNRCFFLFLRLLRCFSSPGSLHTLWIGVWMTEVCSGFPHSDISGSMDICSSPKLFAAYHVFHRLLVPRHPPCALYSLTSLSKIALFGSFSAFYFVFSIHPRCLDILNIIIFNIFQGTQIFQFCFRLLLCKWNGEIRTLDPCLQGSAPQLSYTPIKSGSHLLSHAVSHSTIGRLVLTIVFGMGTGVPLSASPPEIFGSFYQTTIKPLLLLP